MTGLILRFAGALKCEGVMVSVPMILNALESLQWIDLLDTSQFHAAMQACMIQNVEDQETFQKVFHRFFVEKIPLEYSAEDQSFKLHIQDFAESLRRDGVHYDHILADYIEGDVSSLMNQMGIQGLDSGRYHGGDGAEKAKGDTERGHDFRKRVNLMIELAEDFSARSFGMSRDKREKMSDIIRRRLLEAAALLTEKPVTRVGRNHIMPWERKRTLSTISFNQLTQKEIQQVKDEVETLAHKLKDALSQQKKRAKAGHIDIKKTIRDSIKYGGTPFVIHMKTPSRKKGKIVALCDISSSVSYAAQFMMLLLYRLQNRFSKIRSFVFIRHSYEISNYFETYPIEQALMNAVKQHNIGMGQPSNYGSSFYSFLEKFPNVITKDTTLIIMGDGQNNFNDPVTDTFERMTEAALRTIWLNPEREEFWYTPSNSMRYYKPLCDQVVECATLDQLSDFTRNLVL